MKGERAGDCPAEGGREGGRTGLNQQDMGEGGPTQAFSICIARTECLSGVPPSFRGIETLVQHSSVKKLSFGDLLSFAAGKSGGRKEANVEMPCDATSKEKE